MVEATLRGIPEAKPGAPCLLPVNPIRRYDRRLDDQIVPVAEVPPQDVGPWREVLERRLSDRTHHEELVRASRPGSSAPYRLAPQKPLLLALKLRHRAPASPGLRVLARVRAFRYLVSRMPAVAV